MAPKLGGSKGEKVKAIRCAVEKVQLVYDGRPQGPLDSTDSGLISRDLTNRLGLATVCI